MVTEKVLYLTDRNRDWKDTVATALNIACTAQEIRILCACKTHNLQSRFKLRYAYAFTNEPIKWLHKITNNRVCTCFSFQPIRIAIPIRAFSSLCLRTPLLFKPVKTAFAECVSVS